MRRRAWDGGHNPTVTATWRRVLNNNTTFDVRFGGFYNWSSTRGLIENLITPGVYDEIRDVSPPTTRATLEQPRAVRPASARV